MTTPVNPADHGAQMDFDGRMAGPAAISRRGRAAPTFVPSIRFFHSPFPFARGSTVSGTSYNLLLFAPNTLVS